MKRIYLVFCLVTAVLAAPSCKKDNKAPKPDGGKSLSLSSTEQQQASADNSFSFNLFKSVVSQSNNGSNIFVSPLSVSMALGMTINGANGETQNAIQSTLGFNGFSTDQVNSYYNKLVTELPQLDPNTTLKIANSIWCNKNFSIQPQFLQTDSVNFQAKSQSLDFSNKASVNTINNWVSDKTNGKITKLLATTDPQAAMYLINAIYFKSIWASKFDPANTIQQPFILGDNSEVEANFMRGFIKCNTYASNDMTVLELPYSNNRYSMVIVMPNASQPLNDLISGLDAGKWNTWMGQLQSSEANVNMPKFEFTCTKNLNDALTNMGMGVAFSPSADFSRISTSAPLQITSVDHKAYILVDETGTVAAAATSVAMGTSAAPEQQIEINHPFLFVIREMKTGLILFAGTVYNPLQTGL